MFYEPHLGHGLPHDPFKAIIAPRPIGWISSLDKQGRPNLAPYSFFNAVHSSPPMPQIRCPKVSVNSKPPGLPPRLAAL